ncbi:nitrate reductase NapE component [Sinorhizobium kostiense]|uniref:Nitrate reductase NapE component n=1 Tax=Sinorhizobium kostiense TaxID=76747 RepID=A0ABS4QY70_9HYPH|nr:hypothetical protein [Sinorhizobium kostiense]MBP2235597.1 nitrate reductase NapE component [Sinorhizobium kostiense]
MNMQRRRPRAITIARVEERRSQAELIAFAAVLALFTIAAVAVFRAF